MKIGIVKTSLLENEKRLPISPEHLGFIDKSIRQHYFFEKDYGLDYNISDKEILSLGYRVLGREELISTCDTVVLPKPTSEDVQLMKENATIWGWTHCVQGRDIAQIGIDKKLTFLSWENMFSWKNGARDLHIFLKSKTYSFVFSNFKDFKFVQWRVK